MIRRSMLVDVGGVELEPVTSRAHTALKLQAWGYGHAYIGLSTASGSDIFCVSQPFWGQTLQWKQRLVSLQAMLQFYYAVPRLVFFTAPLAYLLAGVHIIQTTPDLLAAYALPHLMQAYLAQARLQGKNRFTVWTDIRETVLAWYLLVPTTMTLLRTELGRCLDAIRGDKADTETPFDWMIAVPYVIILAMNLAGFGVGIARLLWSGRNELEIAVLYLFWAACNVMLLAAMLAVAEESRHIRLQTRLRLRMPAMLQLSSGRTVACETENFPNSDLAITLPTPLALDAGMAIRLSIFRGHREFTFPARVASHQDRVLRVSIEDSAQNDYQFLGDAVLSRGQDWPKWLPGRDADHPLPAWVTKPFIATGVKALLFAEHLGKFVNWARFGSWIKKWKKTT